MLSAVALSHYLSCVSSCVCVSLCPCVYLSLIHFVLIYKCMLEDLSCFIDSLSLKNLIYWLLGFIRCSLLVPLYWLVWCLVFVCDSVKQSNNAICFIWTLWPRFVSVQPVYTVIKPPPYCLPFIPQLSWRTAPWSPCSSSTCLRHTWHTPLHSTESALLVAFERQKKLKAAMFNENIIYSNSQTRDVSVGNRRRSPPRVFSWYWGKRKWSVLSVHA